MAEGALEQYLRVFTSSRQPGGDGGMTVAEDQPGFGRIQPTGSRRQHDSNLVRGGFQTVQGGMAPFQV